MVFKKIAKKFKKGGFRKVARYGAKRVYKRYSKGGMSQVIKDVSMLKGLINTEKKYVDRNSGTDLQLGQLDGNSVGCRTIDMTIRPATGTGFNTRNGQSIKIVSMSIQIQLINQTAQKVGTKIRFEMYLVKGDPKDLQVIQGELYDVNPLTGIIDFQSNRNPNNFSDYKLVCKRQVYYPPEQNNSTLATQREVNKKIYLKLNHHLRYSGDTTTLVTGQYVMIALCSSGNASTTTPTTTVNRVSQTAINTGFTYNVYHRTYYVDN